MLTEILLATIIMFTMMTVAVLPVPWKRVSTNGLSLVTTTMTLNSSMNLATVMIMVILTAIATKILAMTVLVALIVLLMVVIDANLLPLNHTTDQPA